MVARLSICFGVGQAEIQESLQYILAQFFPGSSSAWLERCVRDAEVASSNLVSPIEYNFLIIKELFFVIFHKKFYSKFYSSISFPFP